MNTLQKEFLLRQGRFQMSHAREAHCIGKLLALLLLEMQNDWETKRSKDDIGKLLALLLLETQNDWQTKKGHQWIRKLLALLLLENLIRLSVGEKGPFAWQVTCSPLIGVESLRSFVLGEKKRVLLDLIFSFLGFLL